MKVLLIEPFFTGSHQQWAVGFQKYSTHEVQILKLSGHHWKWRMHGGAITLARRFLELNEKFDVILCTDMLDLTTFQSLTRSQTWDTLFVLYFHENQLMYPFSQNDTDRQVKRDNHYAFINYASALAADQCWYNSEFHRSGFIRNLKSFLNGFPDHNELGSVPEIEGKSMVMPLGLDLSSLKTDNVEKEKQPVILWNHRWEEDKDPETFFTILFQIKDQGIPFHLVVLGEEFEKSPGIFSEAKERLTENILQWGFVDSREEYAHWLSKSDLIPVTSMQDFFGASVIEAIYCGVLPLLPDRLAFPEHIPDSMKEQCVYQSSEDLKDKLIQYLEEMPTVVLSEHVSQYDWKNVIGKYDEKIRHLKKAT